MSTTSRRLGIPGCQKYRIESLDLDGFVLTLNFAPGTVSLAGGSSGFSITALLTFIQALATDVPILVTDVENVFATSSTPPPPGTPAPQLAYLPRNVSLPHLSAYQIMSVASDGSTDVCLTFKPNSTNITGGPEAFNVTALLKLIEDLATMLPVLIADGTAVFATATPAPGAVVTNPPPKTGS